MSPALTAAEAQRRAAEAGRGARGTKEEERTKPGAPPLPSPDPLMFAGILGEITAAAEPTTEADPVGIYASLLAGAGVLAGPEPHVRIGNTRHPLLIWALLLGRTGTGRKGEATGTAEIFLRRAASASFDDLTVTGLSSGEGLIERIRDGGSGDEQKRLLVIEPEFTSVMARSKREGSTLAAVQRQAWDGKPLSVLNRQQLKASSSHVAVIGHITPREFRLRLADADLSGGTYNRYLPVFVERTRLLPIPEGVNEETKVKLGGRLNAAIERAAGVGCIQLDRDATQLWTSEIYPELTGADDEDHAEAEFTRRAAPYCLRIAGLLAALDGRKLMGKPDLAAAAALVRYSIASARFVLDRQARDPRFDRIRRAVDAAGQAGLSRSAISGLFSRNLTKEVLSELLVQLTENGEYEETRTATKGRPAETYRRKVLSSSFVSIGGKEGVAAATADGHLPRGVADPEPLPETDPQPAADSSAGIADSGDAVTAPETATVRADGSAGHDHPEDLTRPPAEAAEAADPGQEMERLGEIAPARPVPAQPRRLVGPGSTQQSPFADPAEGDAP